MGDAKIILDQREVTRLIRETQESLEPYYRRLAEIAARKPVRYLYSPRTNELNMVIEDDTAEEKYIKQNIIEKVLNDLKEKINPK